MRLWLIRTILFFLAASMLLPVSVYGFGSYSYSGQVAVLAYHHLSETPGGNVTITPDLLRRQLRYLQEKGYTFITLHAFRDFMNGGGIPRKSVLVTFDDGYESFYTHAFPILKELGIPAVNFVVTKDLDDPKSPPLPLLSKDEIRQMTGQADFIDFQCHSHDMHAKVNGKPLLISLLHTEGRTESAEQYRQRILNDTRACIGSLHALHFEEVDMYAYPYGMYDQNASELVRQAGIRYAFTVVDRIASPIDDPMQIPRINAGNPSITPESLHRTIMRRAVTAKLPLPQLAE